MSTPRSHRPSRIRGPERAPSRWRHALGSFSRVLSARFIGLAVVLGLMYAIVLFLMSYTQWREFRAPDDIGSDFSSLNQSFYLAVHDHGWFHSPILTNRGGHRPWSGSLLAFHFFPVYYLVLPFYALWPSLLMLFLLASLAVAACGTVVLLAAHRIFGSPVAALIWFGLFILHPTVPEFVLQNGLDEGFVAAAFLGLALLFYMAGNYRPFFLMLFLALLCKEDIGLVLPVWAVVAWFQGKGRRLAGAVALLGIVYFAVANAIALPLIRGEPVGHIFFWSFWSAVGRPHEMLPGHGESLGAFLSSFWSAPGGIIPLVFGRQNVGYWAEIFGPLLFLPFLGWEYWVIPALVYVEISLFPGFQVIGYHHVAPALPFIFVAAMLGASRFSRVVESALSGWSIPSTAVRKVSLVALLCGMVGSTVYTTPFPATIGTYWPTTAGLRREAPLFETLSGLPPQASLAATADLIDVSSSRDKLYGLPNNAANVRQVLADDVDYIAVSLSNLDDSSQARNWIPALLCQGAYGVVYADRHDTRFVLERGADLGRNLGLYATLFPGAGGKCPVIAQENMSPQVFARAASFHVRTHFPSVVRSEDTFVEPVAAVSTTRFTQVIHLPDHTFTPGRYRLDLTGAWPWFWAPASYRLTAEIFVGQRMVGQATAGWDQPLHYTTPPFLIERRVTLPVRVLVDLQTPRDPAGTVWAFRPAPDRCAVVADAPSLNPQQVTVEAWVYLEGMNAPPGGMRAGLESEGPILDKGAAPGYYLRLSGDDQGKVWVDLNVAGKWAAGRAGFVPYRKWTHVAATYDGQEVKIYVNGRLGQEAPSRSSKHIGRIRSQESPLAIGCRNPGTRDQVTFRGLIESASVWNRVLTAQEIQEHAGTWVAPSPGAAGLVGSWDFRPPPEPDVPDVSANGNRITNGAALTRVPAPEITQPFVAWHSRVLNIVRLVTISGVP